MKIRIGDAVIEGTEAELKSLVSEIVTGDMGEETLAKLGLYKSSSKGIIEIEAMDSQHIRSVLAKRMDDWSSEFRKSQRMRFTNAGFTTALTTGISEDPMVLALLTQLARNGED